MRRSIGLVVVALIASLTAVVGAGPASAMPIHGDKEWAQLHPNTGLTWAQVASVCPTDGATPCAGAVGGKDLTGWVWATSDQVLGLMETYAPGIKTATPPAFSGPSAFWYGYSFLNAFRWTTYTALTYSYTEYTSGWTASLDGGGLPIAGSAHFHTPQFSGSIGIGSLPDGASPYRGVFLWRTAGLDYTGPVVTPTVTGTLGSSGWYRSDVGISWTVTDPESEIISTEGCDPTSLISDTLGATSTCTATSTGVGGPGSATVTVKRDATAPAVTCGATPTFSQTQFPAYVSASVADATSGPSPATVTVLVNTAAAGTWTAALTGRDVAGNTTGTTCPYNVVTPTCAGKAASIVGTGGNDTLVGTKGADVIIGLAGSDTIKGGGGSDTICGGDGNDDLHGGAKADTIDGGLGSDSIRGDDGADRCTSGEVRMSSCATIY